VKSFTLENASQTNGQITIQQSINLDCFGDLISVANLAARVTTSSSLA